VLFKTSARSQIAVGVPDEPRSISWQRFANGDIKRRLWWAGTAGGKLGLLLMPAHASMGPLHALQSVSAMHVFNHLALRISRLLLPKFCSLPPSWDLNHTKAQTHCVKWAEAKHDHIT
jgi:hypothetical protein